MYKRQIVLSSFRDPDAFLSLDLADALPTGIDLPGTAGRADIRSFEIVFAPWLAR